MCGRFTNRYSWREIKELYDLTTPYLTSNFPPRYNIAPTQQSFVARVAKDGSRELAELKWGLIPSWSKDDQSAVRIINARAETVASLPAFRAAFKSRPCLSSPMVFMNGRN
jgi:putative SOS response-associated peptidase YedK